MIPTAAPLIMVDFGTSTTFDVVDEDGNYFGGVIAPGINLSIEALSPDDGAAAAHRRREAQAGDRHDDRRLPCSPASSGAMSA